MPSIQYHNRDYPHNSWNPLMIQTSNFLRLFQHQFFYFSLPDFRSMSSEYFILMQSNYSQIKSLLISIFQNIPQTLNFTFVQLVLKLKKLMEILRAINKITQSTIRLRKSLRHSKLWFQAHERLSIYCFRKGNHQQILYRNFDGLEVFLL